MPTILSRFDMIFVVKDHHNRSNDTRMVNHVINVHSNTFKIDDEEIPLHELKGYINYCRKTCGPRLNSEAGDKLRSRYVIMRDESRTSIPITVRQLESIIRMSEALAKLELKSFATDRHLDEALRLFHVSTIQAAADVDRPLGDEVITDEREYLLSTIEKKIKEMFTIGSCVTEENILQTFAKLHFTSTDVRKALQSLIRCGQIVYRVQRNLLLRVA